MKPVMRAAQHLAAAFLFLVAASSPARAADDIASKLTPAQLVSYQHAIDSFRARRYAAAYGRFASLADAGDVASARIALLMYREGRALFGSDWSATLGQQLRWTALIVNAARGQPFPVAYNGADD